MGIPKLAFHDFIQSSTGGEEFLEKLSRHSYIVLTDLPEGVKLYEKYLHSFRTFLKHNSYEVKETKTGPIYTNERGVPMWHVGYEKTQVRESWRFPTARKSLAGYNYEENTSWPDPEFKNDNLNLIKFLKKVCDRALELAVGLLPGRESFGSDLDSDREDMCTTHSFQYPNSNIGGFSPQLPGILVKEHTDKSMFVAEFCPTVRGLEVFDLETKEWYMTEDHLDKGKDLIIFAGEGLSLIKHLFLKPIEPCLHRVAESPGLVRECFIFEQKYGDYIRAGKENQYTKEDIQNWKEIISDRSQNETILDEGETRIQTYLYTCSLSLTG